MLNQKRGTRGTGARRDKAVRLQPELLEDRRLLTAIDLGLGNTTGTILPNIARQPYGIEEVGATAGAGAGWSVTDVGDVNGSGYDSFVVGAPTVFRNTNGTIAVGGGTSSRAFLIFGSRSVNLGTINYAILNPQARIGDLGLLGNPTQSNPVNPVYTGATDPNLSVGGGFAYDGLTFFNGSNPTSRLGSSVVALGDINGDGYADFMIGAPGASDAAGTGASAGRAYIVYGAPTLSTTTVKTIDLDNPVSVGAAANVLTLTTNNLGSNLGASGAGIGDVLTDGFPDIAVGAPTATTPTGLSQAGEVYVISGAFVRTPRTATINVDNIGQNGDTTGIVFSGAKTGDQAGFSIAGAGNFDGATTTANQSIDDLLIGAPQTGFGSGSAYLVYGATNLFSRVVTTNGFTSISLARIGDPGLTNNTLVGNVAGVQFTGAAGSVTPEAIGYAVSSAGNFSSTNVADILIGAPGANSNAGRVNLIRGQRSVHWLLGTVYLDQLFGTTNPNTNLLPNQAIEFTGEGSGALAGYSLTSVGRIANVGLPHNDVAIGSPGLTGTDGPGSGAVYLIVNNSNLTGTQSLANAFSNFGIKITVSGSVAGGAFLGASVSSTNVFPGQTKNTTDQDLIGDLVIGAPGYGLAALNSSPPTTARRNGGAAFVLEGRFLQTLISTSGTNNGGGNNGGGGTTTGGAVGGVFAGIPIGLVTASQFIPPIGERLVPTIDSLQSENSYQPIARSIAYAQFLPGPAYIARAGHYDGKPSSKAHVNYGAPGLITHFGHQRNGLGYSLPKTENSSPYYGRGKGVESLGSHVFNRGIYHAGKTIKVHHKVAVIPANRQNEIYR